MPERKYETTVEGVAIYSNPSLTEGTIHLSGPSGNPIGAILNVRHIDIGSSRSAGSYLMWPYLT